MGALKSQIATALVTAFDAAHPSPVCSSPPPPEIDAANPNPGQPAPAPPPLASKRSHGPACSPSAKSPGAKRASGHHEQSGDYGFVAELD